MIVLNKNKTDSFFKKEDSPFNEKEKSKIRW